MASSEHSRTTPKDAAGPLTAERPPSGLRTDLTVFAGPVRRFGQEEPRRALDGGMAESAGASWGRLGPEDRALRACPSVDRPATPRLLGRQATREKEQGRQATREKDQGRQATREKEQGRQATREKDQGRQATREKEQGRQATRDGEQEGAASGVRVMSTGG
jgi:hypothetical protein